MKQKYPCQKINMNNTFVVAIQKLATNLPKLRHHFPAHFDTARARDPVTLAHLFHVLQNAASTHFIVVQVHKLVLLTQVQVFSFGILALAIHWRTTQRFHELV